MGTTVHFNTPYLYRARRMAGSDRPVESGHKYVNVVSISKKLV